VTARRSAALRGLAEPSPPAGLDARALKQVFDQAIIGLALVDADQRYLRANTAFCQLTGHSEDELLGLTLGDTIDAEVDADSLPAGLGMTRSDERNFLRADGRVMRARVTRTWLRVPAGAARLLVQAEDLEAVRHAGRVAQLRAERHMRIAALSRKALHGLDPAGLLEEAAATVADVLGIEAAGILTAGDGGEALAGARAPTRAFGRDRKRLAAPIVLNDCPYATIELRLPDQRTLNLEELQFLHEVADVVEAAVERAQREGRISHGAHHDPLTGLANRALLVDRLQHALARSARSGAAVAVLFADLDRFKVVNDSLGHAAGDALLVEVAARLQATLRLEDTIARLGGDEFVMVCSDLGGPREAEVIAGRVVAALSRPHDLDGTEVIAPPSIGIALASGAGVDAEDLIADADLAMYQAKAAGRGCWALFSAALRGDTERVELEADLRHAVERDELLLHYQPVFDLATGRIVGAEALVRWQHPARGLLAPDAFVPLAEDSGLIVPVSHWVIAEACRQATAWVRADGGFRISVNVSARLLTPEFGELVRRTLADAALAPSSLVIEVTETTLMQDGERAVSVLTELRQSGVRISVDDFGTGYSSLAYLKRLPVDCLKVDRSFVRELGPAAEDSAIVAAVVALARSVGLEVVAEGVETAEQLSCLRALGCQGAQGYLFSRPLPAPAFAGLLASRPCW
jgi:diguanylate cyclase (GGDEF)-like protein/PAS domain S-box-containing protein